MKIGKITIDGYYNYGNLLQNYALQRVLLKYADQVDTIWHSKNNFLPETFWQWSWKDPIKYLINRNRYKDNFRSGHFGYEMVRQGKFRDWAERYIHMRQNVKNLSLIANEYDYFVTGSDQVWNPFFFDKETLKEQFLEFTPDVKRLSYAASISVPEIPSDKKNVFINGINGMHTLSVREKAGAALIEKLTGRKAEVHVDPTMLLKPDEWRHVSRVPSWYHGEEYILTYFLGKRPQLILDKIHQRTGLKVINLLDYSCYDYYVTGVDEFIWAVKHAKLMFTDSFHGTVFSILFHTPFVVCNRNEAGIMARMGSRLDTLLDMMGLMDRRAFARNNYEIANPLDSPDWSLAEKALERERKRSDNYFRKILNQ